MIAGLLSAAASAAVSIGFAPPATPLIYEIVQVHSGPQATVRFTARRELRFVRAGAGWRLESTLIDMATDAQGSSRMIFEAGLAPFKGVTVSYMLDARGQFIGAADPDAAWALTVAGYRGIVARADADPALPAERKAGVRAIIARLEAQPAAERTARLLDDFRPLTDHAGLSAQVSEGHTFAKGEMSGRERLAERLPGIARFVLDAKTAAASGGLTVTETTTADISEATGLLLSSRRERITSGPGDAVSKIVETRSLKPLTTP